MKGQVQNSRVRYVIPARTIEGSREEMVAELDDVVRGLLGLRQLISTESAGERSDVEGGPRPRIRLWPRRLYGVVSANR